MIAGQRGSYLESQEAGQLHLGIVPIGMTGGSAKRVWKELNDSFGDYRSAHGIGSPRSRPRDYSASQAGPVHGLVAMHVLRRHPVVR
jgi:hypothetical protein